MKYIYALIDPRTRGVCYVGQSGDPEYRFKQHVSKIEDTPKGTWIRSLKAAGLEPDLIILDKADDQNQVNYLETWWILVGRRQGWQLTNGTNPGEWRVGDDFKTIYADELLRMYAEHRAACERLEAEVIAMAVERERLRWINRLSFGYAILVCLASVASMAQFGLQAWNATDFQIRYIAICLLLLWLIMPCLTYFYHGFFVEEIENGIDWQAFTLPVRVVYPLLTGSVLLAGVLSAVELAKMAGW